MPRHRLQRRLQVLFIWCSVLGLACSKAAVFAANPEVSPEQLKFFETDIRPLLIKRCFKCHGPDKQKGELRLDSHAAALAGGESGPAVVPGKPDESLLLEAVRYESFEMPPDEQLSEEQIALLARWVKMGAPWPELPAGAAGSERITDEDREFWSFQPVKRPEVPSHADDHWSRNEIDRFILAKLTATGLAPSPEASETTLLRRLYFDLIGLPPTPAEIDAYVADAAPDKYSRLVDHLLESPRYGERWGQHWLDLVRYAESDGFRQDAFRPTAWRFRDYVIDSFNNDKPYDRFVLEQLAGDEIAPDDPQALIATGYLRHGVYEYNQRDAETQWSDMQDEITGTTGEVFLGMSVGCARCHDHKFDPILRDDFYRLQAFFAPMRPRNDQIFAAPAERQAYQQQLAQWETATADLRAEIDALLEPSRKSKERSAVVMFPEKVQAMYNKPAGERNSYEDQIAWLVELQVEIEVAGASGPSKGESKERYEFLKNELAKFDQLKPKSPPRGYAVADCGLEVSPTRIPDRVDAEPIPPGFLTVLAPGAASIEPPAALPQSTGRRTALARWIANADNPLSTRVIVNRVWQFHFGRGLAAAASDFGRLGEPPSHPELLDWLTSEFIESGWRFKPLHRLIVNSAAYRQAATGASTAIAAKARTVDPENHLLWRANVRRLDAAEIRDAMLYAAGRLDLKQGGPSVDAKQPRRGVYVKVIRNTRDALLDSFDAPDGVTSTASRNVTTTPIQSLLMINGESPLTNAKSFAALLAKTASSDPSQRVILAYRSALGRRPSEAELQEAIAFLQGSTEPPKKSEMPFAPIPGRPGQAADVGPSVPVERLRVPHGDWTPQGDFTIEAFILLRSLFSDASVRTIASQWDSNTGNPGWALGVTSEQSRYTPRNLILQLVGDPAQGGAGYEVIPSGLLIELNKPYYVAASVRINEKSEAGITFYVQELAGNSPLKSAGIAHQVTQNYASPRAFVIGGRDHRERRHFWDGLIDDVRLSGAALAAEDLLIAGRSNQAAALGFWKFDKQSPLKNSAGPAPPVRPDPVDAAGGGSVSTALVDFCHVLFNSSEFLYVD